MRAMVLAAGRGTRMGQLTTETPKPLLRAGGRTLLQHQLERLARAGIRDIVVNHARYGARIEEETGDGSALGVRITYSAEGDAPLETAGGIRQALPLLGSDPFLVVNADVWTSFDYASLVHRAPPAAHLVLVANPAHHETGDFVLSGGQVTEGDPPRLTFGGIGVYQPALFRGLPPGPNPLAPLLRAAMARGQVTGEFFQGHWFDIGTPQRLAELETFLSQGSTS